MTQPIKYPLTDDAKAGARLLVKAWDAGILPQTMLFGHYHQGKKAFPTFFDLQGNQIKYDDAPERGVIFEYAQFGLITLRTFREGNTLEVILLQSLRDAVYTDFEVSAYFMAVNAAGVLNMNGGTVNILDSSPIVEGRHSNNTLPTNPPDQLVRQVRDVLGDLPDERDDLEAALVTLAASSGSKQQRAITRTIAALGRALNHGEDDGRVMKAVDLLMREMGS